MLIVNPQFNHPILVAAGVISIWLIIFFPFAVWAQLIVRNDALSRFEAYILGQTSGPVGVYLVMRANRRAAEKQYKAELLAETLKTHEPQAGIPPEEVWKEIKELGRPQVLELPGGRAWRAPPKEGLVPAKRRTTLDTVGLGTQVRPGKDATKKNAPFEPPDQPPTKAANAFRPPPKDYKFTHSDEQPEAVDNPQDGDPKDR